MKKSPVEVFADSGQKYRKDMTGMYKCHLRALSNVSKAAAVEAMDLQIKHDQTEKVLDVLKNHVDGINGNIFHLRKIHWVALVKVSGSDEAIYFDDMVMMYMKNYEGSLAAFNILETMTSHKYSKVFPAPICYPVLTPAPILPPNPARAPTPAPVPPLDHTPALPKEAKVPATVPTPPFVSCPTISAPSTSTNLSFSSRNSTYT